MANLPSPVNRWVQFGGAAFFGLLAALDAVSNANPVPHLSSLGLGLALVTALFLLAPYVVRFKATASSVDVELQSIAAESTEDLEAAVEAIGSVADLTQDWLSQVNWINRQLQLAEVSDQEAQLAVVRFCRERLADVVQMVGNTDEKIRASVWWFSAQENGLVFLLSDQIKDEETKSFVFRSGQGILGQAYAENRFWNIPDAPSEPGYVQIRKEPPAYHGLICMPILFGGHEKLGIVCVDRERAERFSEVDKDLVAALADVLGYALTLPRVTLRFGVLPPPAIAVLEPSHEPLALPEPSAGETGEI